MTAQPAQLNTDSDSKRTSSTFADSGDGTSRWFQWRRTANGGDVAQGSTTDAAVTDPTAAGSVVSILKGILTASRLSAAGLLKAEDAVKASGDSGVMALAVRRDTAVSDVSAAGDYSPIHVDALGRLRVTNPQTPSATNAADVWSRVASAGALGASLVVKASAGRVRLVQVTSTLASVQFLQVFNATSLPANGATPTHVVAIPASSSAVLDLGDLGDYHATGIVVAVSTTAATLTVGAADSVFSALFI